MRGFGVQRLSPPSWAASRPRPCRARTVPIGGNGLFESSVEIRYALTQTLTVATFVDAGFVTSRSVELALSYFTDNMLFGIGGGIRLRTPVGPVRLDIAYRPNIGPPLPVYVPPSLCRSSCPAMAASGLEGSPRRGRDRRRASARSTSPWGRRFEAVGETAGRGIARAVGTVFLLVSGAWLFLSTRPGEAWLRRELTQRIDAAIAGSVRVGDLDLLGPHLSLRELALLDPEGKVVARVAQADVGFSPLALLRRTIQIDG